MSWWSRARNALSTTRLEREIDEELADHLERRAAEFRDEGLSAAEAERRARRLFGNVALVRERSRDVRLWPALDHARHDLRHAWRGLRRSPAFAGTAVLSLGLAIGSITAVYAIVDAAFLRPLPVPNPGRLFTLARPMLTGAVTSATGDEELFSYPLYRQLKTAAAGTAGLTLIRPADRAEGQLDDAGTGVEELSMQYVSGDALETLGVRPAAGRLLSPEDDRDSSPAPVVISYKCWRRLFNLEPAAIGRRLFLDGRRHTIIGVTAEGFVGVEPGTFVDAWLPASAFDPGAFTNPDANWFRIIGRLSGTSTRAQLQARLQPVFHQDQVERVQRHTSLTPGVHDALLAMPIVVEGGLGVSELRRVFARPLWMVFGVAATLLLIACANVASLLLARSSARATEMSLRVSLGAGRSRLVRQLLTENLLLAVFAGVIGWLLARLAAPLLAGALAMGREPIQLALVLDLRVLAFCLVVSACSMLVFGLIPSWQASRTRPVHLLRGDSQRSGRLRGGSALVGFQCAFAFSLLVAATAFFTSLWHLTSRDPGFSPRDVVVLTVGAGGRPSGLVQAQQLQARIAALPGIQSAAFAWLPILDGRGRRDQVLVAGQPPSAREEIFARVSPGYLATLRIPLVAGRDLAAQDDEGGASVPTLVNRAFAERYFGTDAVLNRQFNRADGTSHHIVGVTANAAYTDLRSGPEPVAYFPMKPPRQFIMYVRTALDAGTLLHLAEREAAALGPAVRIAGVTTLETMMSGSLQRERLLADVAVASGAIGVLLAAIGLFGLLNYTVIRRTNEIGIRAALGATRGELMALVLRDAAVPVGAALAAGTVGSIGLLSLTGSMLYGVGRADPLVIGCATAVFLVAALAAAALPARRATAIDPLSALRTD